jgi:hypothetical protein
MIGCKDSNPRIENTHEVSRRTVPAAMMVEFERTGVKAVAKSVIEPEIAGERRFHS